MITLHIYQIQDLLAYISKLRFILSIVVKNKLIKYITSVHTHTHIYPMKYGLPEIEHFDEANSFVPNPTVEMNREIFHTGGPKKEGREMC